MDAFRSWPLACVTDLAHCLVSGDASAVGEWVTEHVGVEWDRWEDFAATLAWLAGSGPESAVRSKVPGEVVFSPEPSDTGDWSKDHAVLLVTMAMNRDVAGARGLIGAARDAGELEGFCGVLGGLAAASLRQHSGWLLGGAA